MIEIVFKNLLFFVEKVDREKRENYKVCKVCKVWFEIIVRCGI